MTPLPVLAGAGGDVEGAVARLDLIEHQIAVVARRPRSVPPRSEPGAGPDRPSRLRRLRSARTAGSASSSRRRCNCRCRPGCWRCDRRLCWICCAWVAMALRSGAGFGRVVRLEREIAQALQLALNLRQRVVLDVQASLGALAVGGVLLALRQHLVVAAHQAGAHRILRRGGEREPGRDAVLRGRDGGLELIQRASRTGLVPCLA